MLRKLELSDAKEMLKWMHDESVVGLLPTHFNEMTIEDCGKFIKKSWEDQKNIHFAVTDEEDKYLGTISLKNIDEKNLTAKYAVVLGKSAIGRGIAKKATDDILKYAFDKMKLDRVYLCVFSDNIRAVKFYQKYGFQYEGTFRSHMYGAYDNVRHDLQWYGILREEFTKRMNEV